MNSFRTAKEVKKGSTSPLKTPEKSRIPRNSPVVKKQMVRSKLTTMPKKMSHTKSTSQIAYLELVKQTSVNQIEAFEKIRRITAFSRLRPTFEVLKASYFKHLDKFEEFVRVKTLFKCLEVLKDNLYLLKNKELIRVLDEIGGDEEKISIAEGFRKRKLMELGMNGMLKYYVRSYEVQEAFDEFYERKIKRKCFEAIFLDSKFDEVVEDFLKVSTT